MIYMRIKDEVTAFQLGSSTVVTIPKGMGIKPGQKLTIKKSKNGTTLRLEKKKSLLKILEETRGAWANMDWEAYDKREKERRKFELAAAQKMRRAW